MGEGDNIKHLKEIAKMIKGLETKIVQNGGNIYLVGGSIRDIIMEDKGILSAESKPKDYDFCITGLYQNDFERIFPDSRIQGKDFPVFVLKEIPNCEFSLARKERKVGEGHRGFEIMASPEVSIEDDLIRRDLTINSMAYNFSTQKIIDPFGGVEDIERKILRAVSPAFREDPLRVYRVAQFSARYGFQVEPNTIRMMKELKGELGTISPERVFVEMRKALRTSQPARFFEVLSQAEVLDIHFLEIARLIGVQQPIQYHPEGDAFEHTMIVLDKVADETDREEVRFAALVHDVGKGSTDQSLWPRHIGHDKAGAALVAEMARRLKIPRSWENAGKVSASEHMRAGRFDDMNPGKKVALLEKIARTKLGLKGLEIITCADGNNARFAKLGEKMLEEVNGDALGVQQGKEAAQKIHEVRVKWMREQSKVKSL